MKVSKNSKSHEKPKRRNWRARCPLARASGALKGGSFRIFQHPLLQNNKIEGGPFCEKKFPKKTHNAGKTERGDHLGFFNIHSVAKH